MTTKSISHYKIIEKIGQGGMGVVYKAEDSLLKRKVAVKLITQSFAADEEIKQRFVLEARAASSLQHNNICTIHEIGETEDKQLFICMDYYEGQTLKSRIGKGALTVEETLDIVTQIAAGLAKAHEKGIIHRDIKPANIFITEDGTVKILDFGLVKMIHGDATVAGNTYGTASYMSPEQAMGKAVDESTDIWSLGVILFEMLAGALPFKGEYDQAVIYSIINEVPHSIRKVRKDIPVEIEQIILKCLSKNPKQRYKSGIELSEELNSIRSRMIDRSQKKRSVFLRPATISTVIIVIAVIILFGYPAISDWRNSNYAKNNLIPQLIQLGDEGKYFQAFTLAKRIEQIIPGDPVLLKMKNKIMMNVPFSSKPENVDLYANSYGDSSGSWVYIGKSSPVISVPKGPLRIRVEKQGYEKVESIFRSDAVFSLNADLRKTGDTPAEMVKLPKEYWLCSLDLYDYNHIGEFIVEEFLIDKFEVTNEAYAQFIKDGGYSNKKYWKESFVKDGKILTFEEAVSYFKDVTGRTGPSTWELGRYPRNEDSFPVSGISWFEASAYAEYAGKILPSIYHWDKTAYLNLADLSVRSSNFGNTGPSPVGSFNLGPVMGVYDIAGNVREWCFNDAGGKRFTAGGAWNDPAYTFTQPVERDPFDRARGNGFRCMKLLNGNKEENVLFNPLIPKPSIDWNKEKPFSEETFRMWKEFTSYTQTPLSPEIEMTDTAGEDWKMEKISFNAAYNNDRMQIYLFLPKNTRPPYQAVIFWPGAEAFFLKTSQNGKSLGKFGQDFWSYYIKDGRALVYPVLLGTFERGGNPAASYEKIVNETMFEKDIMIKQTKDIMRTCDYLDTRNDIDHDKIAFCGLSWGAHVAPLPCSMEKRIKTGILVSGSMMSKEEFGFAHHVKIPILMINGRYDNYFPHEKTQIPFFNAFETPAADKKHVVYESDHMLSGHRIEMMKETLNWLDKYLGQVNK